MRDGTPAQDSKVLLLVVVFVSKQGGNGTGARVPLLAVLRVMVATAVSDLQRARQIDATPRDIRGRVRHLLGHDQDRFATTYCHPRRALLYHGPGPGGRPL
jgi:hypothetical protein